MLQMRRHQGLEIAGIRKLVSESRGMETTDEVLTSTMAAMEKLVEERFSKGKKLDGGRLKNLLKSCDDIFHDRIRPIRAHVNSVAPTRVHPKADAHEVCYVGVKRQSKPVPGFDTLYQLFSFRLYATRKSVSMSLQSLPYAFQYHAAERLMERAENVDTAFWQIAADLAEWSSFIRRAEYFAKNVNGGALSIPVMGTAGMLIGQFAPLVASPSDRLVFADGTRLLIGVPSRADEAQRQMFVGVTFINRFIMRPNQAYAMSLLTDWRARFSDTYTPSIADSVWDRRVLTSQSPLCEESKASLSTILDDPTVRRALHPDWKVNKIIDSDWGLPLGDWAHERYKDDNRDRQAASAA